MDGLAPEVCDVELLGAVEGGAVVDQDLGAVGIIDVERIRGALEAW